MLIVLHVTVHCLVMCNRYISRKDTFNSSFCVQPMNLVDAIIPQTQRKSSPGAFIMKCGPDVVWNLLGLDRP